MWWFINYLCVCRSQFRFVKMVEDVLDHVITTAKKVSFVIIISLWDEQLQAGVENQMQKTINSPFIDKVRTHIKYLF